MRRMLVLPAIATGLVVMSLCTRTPAAAQVDTSSALQLIHTYNNRLLGSPGVRRVRLVLQSRGVTTRDFEIVHAWSESGGAVSSLVLLDAPSNLRGTSYLWVEDPRTATGLDIYLRIPAGKRRVLRVESSRFDQGVLGSDFSYLDLLWRIPVSGRRFRVVGGGGATPTTIESRPATPEAAQSMAWDRVEYVFARDSNLLASAKYFDASSGGRPAAAAKSLTVSDWRERDGVWAPSTMIMTRAGAGEQRSVMTLLSTRYRTTPLSTGLFEPSSLGEIAAEIERGVPAAQVLERPK